MDFRILGPLEAVGDAGVVRLTGGKQRALLALLLLNADRVVPMHRLLDDLWGEKVPDTAPKMIQIFVSQLRKRLPDGLLRTQAPGYVVDLEGHVLDLRRFTHLAGEGREALAEGRAEAAAGRLRDALALWRGPALGEFEEPFALLEAPRLEEQRLACLEDRIDADLDLARHATLVGELDAIVHRHPQRERLRGQLMLTLYRSGRHAEALASYRAFRRMLSDELGIDPPARLKELERRMLQQDPSLDPVTRSAPALAGLETATAPAMSPPSLAGGLGPAMTCPSCATQAPDGSRFCPSCGAALATGAVPEEMLKLVTVLFADVVGSSARAESLHPEDVRALMTDYFAAMEREILAEGGTTEKFVGDAIMAVFGVPTAHEDDAVRAVRAARRMLERLVSWNAERDPGDVLEIRIGVNTGEVVASAAPEGELLVTGSAVNAAARFQQLAEPGTIVVGDRTARAARSRFALRKLDELGPKGATAGAWLVVGEREAAEPRGVPGVPAPLVGRARELEFLRTAFDRICGERRPELVTVLGDAGIGKSRLVREFLGSLRTEATVLIGRCLPLEQGVTLSPLADMLKAEAVLFDTDLADAAYAKITQLVNLKIDADLTGDRARTAAALASTVGLQAPGDDPLDSLDPRDLYRELVAAWRAFFASVARRAPAIVVIEDLHWADPTMLDVLDELAERLDGPILFVCTARPDLLRSRPGWGGGRRSFSSLPLDPLSSDQSDRLIALLLDVGALPEATRRRVLERAEGNPFFLEEIVRHLIDEDLLVPSNGRWRARNRIDEIELPDSVQAVILARLDLLSPEEKRVAQRAAVVGRFFWDGAVEAIARVDDLDSVLRTLRRREFVVERLSSSMAAQREYVFKHVLIRDVAYESLPRKERGRAHAEAASWVEQTSGDRRGEVAELLAHHYDAAFSYLQDDHLRRKARAEYLNAAANAHRRFAIEQGERFARQAAQLSEPGAERAEALERLGDLHYLVGDAAWRAYADALAELPEGDHAVARLAGKAAVFGARWVGTMQEVPEVDEVRRIIDLGLGTAPSNSRERVVLLVDRGFLMSQRERRRDGNVDAAVQEAAAAAEELGDADLLSAALDLVQAHQMHCGRYGEMYRTGLRRVELVPRLKDVKEIGDTYAVAAWSAQHLGRFREAEAHASACIERSQAIDSGAYLHGLTWRVAARLALGEWEGALADQAEIERVAALDPRELPAGFTMRAYCCAALCHELRGEPEQADRYIEITARYVERAVGLGSPGSHHLPPMALALARRGRFEEALALSSHVPCTSSAGLTLEVLCEIAATRGRWDEAAVLAEAAREEARVGEQLSLPLFADRLEGRAAAARGDVERAAMLLGRSADGFGELEARWEEAWSRLLLAEVLLGNDPALGEGELAAALAVFEELGSVKEVERARALLTDSAV